MTNRNFYADANSISSTISTSIKAIASHYHDKGRNSIIKLLDNNDFLYDFILCNECRMESRARRMIDSYCKPCHDKIMKLRYYLGLIKK